LAQLSWTYVGNGGKHFNVGLFHGPNTGHLMVHCNKQVVLIDFNVLESRTYPLFLDDELLELKVDLSKGRFSYGLEIDKQADTPRNRIRKKTEKKHLRQTLLFFSGLIGLAAVFCGFMLFYNNSQKTENLLPLLEEQGVTATARVYDIQGSTAGYRLRFSFVAATQKVSGTYEILGAGKALSPMGFPLNEGDEFVVSFLPQRPSVHRLELLQPSEKLLESYREMAIEKQLEKHDSQTEAMAACMVDIAYELEGVEGLADFYYQDIPSTEHEPSNELTYKRLVRSVPFQRARERKCW